MPNPWLVLGWLITTLALMAATAAYTHRIDTLALQAYQAHQAAIAEKAATESQTHARAVEEQAETHQASIVQSYQEQLRELSQTHDAAVRAIHAQRLHYDHASACANGMPKARPRATGTDATRACRFSADDADFLISEAHRADALAAKVKALQQVVESDRKVCN